jgi:hypothetical protein
MLQDFYWIKEELSIVNGCFVTIREPIFYCGVNIHIRDTLLLAPGASKGLSQIGKLYGSADPKVVISREDISSMPKILSREKHKFIEYAVRDALIYLKHEL